MNRLKMLAKRYRFFLMLLLIDLVILAASFETGLSALRLSGESFLEMLSIIPPVFVLMGLMDVWVPRETMVKYMGRGSGVRGGICAFLLGSFAAGPLYAAFPMAAVFLKKGVSLTNLFLFLGAWSTTKVPMMLFETTQLGPKFAFTRLALNIIAIAVLAVAMERTTNKATEKEVYEKAAGQVDGK